MNLNLFKRTKPAEEFSTLLVCSQCKAQFTGTTEMDAALKVSTHGIFTHDEPPITEADWATFRRHSEALNYAIFAVNTFMYPDASDPEDVEELEDHADEIVEALIEMREQLRERL